MDVKILFFDGETTGLDSKQHCLHQLGCIIDINGEIKERFSLNIRPPADAIITPEALKVSGVTQEQIMAYDSVSANHSTLTSKLSRYVSKFDKTDKFYLCGFNNRSFDDGFLRRFFNDAGDNYFGSWFWPNSLDALVLATEKMIEKRPYMKNFQQGTVAEHLGIVIDQSKLHDAIYDVEVCRQIYYKLKGVDTDISKPLNINLAKDDNS
jgi:DNA polymerase-3 subunit epsilon